MNVDTAKHPRDIVLTCYICDDQYTGDRIESHLEECTYDWNVEEIDKPEHERIPLPKPTSEFQRLLESVKQLEMKRQEANYDSQNDEGEVGSNQGEDDSESEGEEDEESEEDENQEDSDNDNGSPLEEEHKTVAKTTTESESNIESSLIACPNCNRTFFPERLNIHLKSCKPGKPMKKGVSKRPVYQPPKLKTKAKWQAPKEPKEGESDENVAYNPLPSNKPKKKRNKPEQIRTIDFDEDPTLEYRTEEPKHRKDAESVNYGSNNPMKVNTMTTFSRMDEEDKQDRDQFDTMPIQPMDMGGDDDRVPCANCGRKFNPDRLPIHQKSCNNMKKRTVFNSKNKRVVEGMGGKYDTPKKAQKTSKTQPKKKAGTEKSAKWKRDHTELMKAIKMSRLIKKVEQEGGDISKIPVAPSAPNEDYIECQYCYRRYAPNVADRHIPKCKDMINRPKPPPHILKRLKEEEAEKKSRQQRRRNRQNGDMKRMTANAFGAKLQEHSEQDATKTHYPFKPPLRKIKEENEEGPYKNAKNRRESILTSEKKPKRGQSVNTKYMQSTGFSKSIMANNTSYQSDMMGNNFNDAAISTSTSKHFGTSPMQKFDNTRSYKRSESLMARSTCYSTVPCPHCDRKFSSGAAERHIPICAKIESKPNTLRGSKRKLSNVKLPHLSKTNYNSASFRNSETKNVSENLSKTQSRGLPPTYKQGGSRGGEKTRKDFTSQKCFCGSCGHKYQRGDRFCSMCGEKSRI